MKKLLSVVLVLFLIIPFGVLSAGASETEEYTSGYYTYIASDGMAIITDVDWEVGKIVELPTTLNGNVVVGLGPDAFANTSITHLTIPETVEIILVNTFDYNPDLENITVNEENGVFSSFEGVLYNKEKTCLYKCPVNKEASSYTVPDTVITIYEKAFYECEYVEEIILPDSVEEIGDYAFSSSGVRIATFPKNLKSIGDYAFERCGNIYEVEIPSGVTNIGTGAFDNCCELLSVILPEGIESIEDSTFYYCTKLISVIIPESVTEIGTNAFANCWNLENVFYLGGQDKKEEINILYDNDVIKRATWYYNVCTDSHEYDEDGGVCTKCGFFWLERDYNIVYKLYNTKASVLKYVGYDSSVVTIPSEYKGLKVVGIEENAFATGYSIGSIYIPSSITYIGENAFLNCEFLIEINVAEDNEFYSSESGALFNKDKTQLIRYPTMKMGGKYTIPSYVTDISSYAFSYCDVESVAIPNTVDEIKEGTFYGCALLESITVPKSVNKIGDYAFYYCWSLTDVWYQGDIEEKINVIYGEDNTDYLGAEWHFFGMFTEADGNSYYYRNGVKSTSSGLITYDGKRIYVNKGKFTGASGLITVSGKRAYIDKGYFTGASQLVTINGKKTYINKGYFTGASGLVTISGKKAYINKGYFTGASGIVTLNGKKMYISKGYFLGKSGLVTVGGKKAYINKGYFTGATGIVTINGKKHYINKGYFTGASGKVKVGGKTYTVVKGIVR